MTAYRLTGNDVGTSPCHDGRPCSQRLVRSLSRTARRAALRLGLLWLGLLGLLSACTSEDAILLQIRPPSGVTISEYAVTVQDHDKREILYQSGIQPVAAVSKGRDLFTEPLRLGLKLSQKASYLIHVRAAEGKLVPDGVIPTTRKSEFFFAGIVNVAGTQQLDADLLEVDPMLDRDFDHFPDVVKWPEALTAAKVTYQSKLNVLDCVDRDPGPAEMKLPTGLYAIDINPLAKPRCGLTFDISCGDSVPPCQDKDGDGDPESTDCDDNDPQRFNGNPRPRNCCECTDKASCATNHDKLKDMSTCMPARCNSDTDFDCSGQRVSCFIDEDCDGYSPSDPVVSQRDCDDTNPNIYPGAKKNCDDTSKDWACDGNPSGGCVDCDLDGDGFQRDDKAQGGICPTAAYVTSGKKIDCNDDDRGVFPGSTSYNGASQVMGMMDLAAMEGGGSKVAAMRRLCFNTEVDGTTAQDADCDAKPLNGCPATPTTCDADRDGFPNNTAGCNPNGLPRDNLDSDYQSFPGAPDRCGDGKAQNGVADTPCSNDKDGDGYNADADCDDNDSASHPWALELCDGKDNDCDGLIDELNPDDKGARLVETTKVAPIKKVIMSCTDFYQGECNRDVATTGLKTGRCVCSGLKPGAHDPNAMRKSCPGTLDTTATAPKCFGAQQKAKQTCEAVVANRKDQDCDGRLDAPDGMNLKEYGEDCGVDTGECVAGTVNGCDFSKTNPFSASGGYSVVPAFDEARRYLTCGGATPPSKQLCDGKDENCNGVDDDCSDYTPANSSCCKNVAMCVNVGTDFAHCGDCSTACDTVTANACVNKACMCGSSPACNGARGICKNAMSCVECLMNDDCKDAAKPKCSGMDHCAECIANADCADPKPACDGTIEQCVTCTAGFGCAGMTPKCKVNADPKLSQCVQCLTNADCSGGTPACDTATNTCVPCVAGSGCIAPNAQCKVNVNPAMNSCVQCLGDANCSGSTPACDLGANKCVTCTSTNATACMSPLSQCLTNVDPTLNACVECTAMLQCSGVRPICDLATTNRCTACLVNGDCAGATPKCLKDAMDVTKNACVGCLVNADCMAPNPTCDTTNTHKCVPCLADMDCGAGKFCVTNANPLLNVCVSCRNDTDCGAATPACDTTTKTCVPCRVNGATLPHLGCMNPNAACKANVDPSMNMCVECTQDSHCNGGKTCMMNACG
jgi:Cys-rich repeat protein